MNAKDSRGQAAVLTVLFLTVLLGAAAMSLDVGSWFKAKRDLQAQADAAALAGAQGLPQGTDAATALAIQYATKNGGSLTASGVSFSSDQSTNDTISVQMSAPAPGFFSKLFGLSSVTVGAHAAARTDLFNQARFAAPIGVNVSHPDLSGTNCPCFDDPTTLTLNMVGPGGFKLLNIDGSTGGTNPNTLADWMEHGLDAWMDVNKDYYSDPGSKFNNSGMDQALQDNIGHTLLFPVYDRVDSQGSNLFYHVIGWVGFRLSGYAVQGNGGTISGWFTSVIWKGLQGQTGNNNGNNATNFGANSVQLVN
jgi:putative Flp pilus-assembly TadE/G-like protein